MSTIVSSYTKGKWCPCFGEYKGCSSSPCHWNHRWIDHWAHRWVYYWVCDMWLMWCWWLPINTISNSCRLSINNTVSLQCQSSIQHHQHSCRLLLLSAIAAVTFAATEHHWFLATMDLWHRQLMQSCYKVYWTYSNSSCVFWLNTVVVFTKFCLLLSQNVWCWIMIQFHV